MKCAELIDKVHEKIQKPVFQYLEEIKDVKGLYHA